MAAHYAYMPSRLYNPAVVAESPEEIAESVAIYPGDCTYNLMGGDHATRNTLPAIRNQGAYFGAASYPQFHQRFGDVFVVEKRFIGESGKLPRLSVGSVATLESCTVVMIPQGRSYPNSRYEERVVQQRSATEQAIGVAIFDFLNGKESEVDTDFSALLVQMARERLEALKLLQKVFPGALSFPEPL